VTCCGGKKLRLKQTKKVKAAERLTGRRGSSACTQRRDVRLEMYFCFVWVSNFLLFLLRRSSSVQWRGPTRRSRCLARARVWRARSGRQEVGRRAAAAGVAVRGGLPYNACRLTTAPPAPPARLQVDASSSGEELARSETIDLTDE